MGFYGSDDPFTPIPGQVGVWRSPNRPGTSRDRSTKRAKKSLLTQGQTCGTSNGGGVHGRYGALNNLRRTLILSGATAPTPVPTARSSSADIALAEMFF